jgi:hypothetical protein
LERSALCALQKWFCAEVGVLFYKKNTLMFPGLITVSLNYDAHLLLLILVFLGYPCQMQSIG